MQHVKNTIPAAPCCDVLRGLSGTIILLVSVHVQLKQYDDSLSYRKLSYKTLEALIKHFRMVAYNNEGLSSYFELGCSYISICPMMKVLVCKFILGGQLC